MLVVHLTYNLLHAFPFKIVARIFFHKTASLYMKLEFADVFTPGQNIAFIFNGISKPEKDLQHCNKLYTLLYNQHLNETASLVLLKTCN